MIGNVAKLLLGSVVTTLLVGVVGYLVTREPKRTMSPVLETIVKKCSKDFAAGIPEVRELNDVLFLIVQRGNRDEEEQCRKIVEQDVANAGKYRIKTWDDILKKLKGLGRLLEQAGFIADEAPDSFEDARKAVKLLTVSNVKIDGVLVVKVAEFSSGDHGLGAKFALEGELHDLKSGKKTDLPRKAEAITSAMDYTYLSNRLAEMSWFGRFLAWAAMAGALPFVLKKPIGAIASKKRNDLLLTVLIVLTVIDLGLGWALITALGTGWGSLLLLGVLAAAMGYYNHDAVEYVDKWLR